MCHWHKGIFLKKNSMFLFCALTWINRQHDRPKKIGEHSEQNSCEMMYLTSACEANVFWSSLGSQENPWSEFLDVWESCCAPPPSNLRWVPRHWTSVRLIRLKEVVAGLPVWVPVQCRCCYCCQPEPKLQSTALRTMCWDTDKDHMKSLLWFRRKQTARGWPATHREVRIYAWKQPQRVTLHTCFQHFSWGY